MSNTEKYIPYKRCEKCTHYLTIDSGYGFCLRFPPQVVAVGFFRQHTVSEYPVVEWTRIACAELEYNQPYPTQKEII